MRHNVAVKGLADATAWIVGFVFALSFHHDLTHGHGGYSLGRVELAVALAVGIHLTLGWSSGLYRNHWRFGSFEETFVLAAVTFGTAVVLFALDAVAGTGLIPPILPFGAAMAALLVMMTTRYWWRMGESRRRRPTTQGRRQVLVFGAGEGGSQLLASVLRNRSSSFVPVALLDDDPARRHLRIMGVRVAGTRRDISVVAKRYGADTVIMAIPSAGSELVREITDLAREAGLEVRVVPPTNELLDRQVTAGDVRPPTIVDLLGRRQVSTDLVSISSYLAGRRVLVTGAGGSIGSELCRQLHQLGPTELIMLDRDESALHDVQLSLDGRGLLNSPDLVLVDIRDAARLTEVFAERRPDVVFHAAALKHLPLLESYPGEAVKSNVWGTLNVLQAAMAAGVDRFVNISTDKAADPCSVLGFSKRIAERLTSHMAEEAQCGTYLSVRFGNVLGSRGSMLGAFRSMIEGGGPVSVTNPDATRYFMTIEEAAQLVVQAGALGGPGEALVLDMGEPVRIADVAQRLIDDSGQDIDIVFTGRRPGEKLHEDLFGSREQGSRPGHPLISHVQVPPLVPKRVLDLPCRGGRDDMT
ncbi:MAG: polysaccharide biosynthesis protein, partial [Actinomycetota bacterium]|nr:polysaccharide biosynthesis protein [Actinomycetota bacterium]